jgi:hypothetical protein
MGFGQDKGMARFVRLVWCRLRVIGKWRRDGRFRVAVGARQLRQSSVCLDARCTTEREMADAQWLKQALLA